ncbi:MAG: ATP-binding cassette domain-containing protein [Spirochaetales bacterium]|nr:ATP-binding cassette domain-containing protein [Spirochaetales bacterium]
MITTIPALKIEDLSHSYDKEKNVLFNVNLEIHSGEIVSLIGPSGCGKSTLLRSILGTHRPTSGKITVFEGEKGEIPLEVTKPTRDCGIVYQKYSLYPNLTALENVAFGLMLDEATLLDRMVPFKKINLSGKRDQNYNWRQLKKIHFEEASEMLDKVRLSYAKDRYPHELSGGECQRVAIAQALIMKPRILLLDEPFGALDESTREELQRLLLTLYAENLEAHREGKRPPYTILIVTHELKEALLVGDRIIGLSQFWNSADHKDRGAHNSSTVIYDKSAPIFKPEDVGTYQDFTQHIDEIRHAVFDPTVLQEREQFLEFWDEMQKGMGEGLFSHGEEKES